jgi:triosephosphate isomerase (TIM)
MENNKSLIVGNWKMNKTIATTKSFVTDFLSLVTNKKNLSDIVICPPIAMYQFVKELPLKFGAQDCSGFSANEGSFTGDVSAMMLKDIGIDYVIIGHSERRKNYSESGDYLKRKIANAHENGLIVIFCVGENLDQRNDGSYFDILSKQLEESLPDSVSVNNTIIAYEPVWAIGTGNSATEKQIEEIHSFLASKLKNKILYGGSVNSKNAKAILAINNVFGLLIGGASLEAKEFTEIINIRG